MAVNPPGVKSAPLIKNLSAAPVIFFDGAPALGVMNGVVEIELTARALALRADSTVFSEIIAAGRLRCSIQAATNLREALDKALAMANVRPDDAKLDS